MEENFLPFPVSSKCIDINVLFQMLLINRNQIHSKVQYYPSCCCFFVLFCFFAQLNQIYHGFNVVWGIKTIALYFKTLFLCNSYHQDT